MPKQVGKQWADEIAGYWPNITLVISSGEHRNDFGPQHTKRMVLAKDARDRFPEEGKPKKRAAKFENTLDRTNAIARKTIWLWTYETFNRRVSWLDPATVQQSYDPPRYEADGKTEKTFERLIRQEYTRS